MIPLVNLRIYENFTIIDINLPLEIKNKLNEIGIKKGLNSTIVDIYKNSIKIKGKKGYVVISKTIAKNIIINRI